MTLYIQNSHQHDDAEDGEMGLAVAPAKPKLAEPPMYQVVLLNDDYTPMEFVVEVLQVFFAMSHEQAFDVMYQVHFQGKGLCGVFTRDIAETKVMQVIDCARENGHPLLCECEPVQ